LPASYQEPDALTLSPTTDRTRRILQPSGLRRHDKANLLRDEGDDWLRLISPRKTEPYASGSL
jgi:hypothetical protein